jgi:AcrR family transcriptional regulator
MAEGAVGSGRDRSAPGAYDSSGRRARAAEGRSRVVRAAHDLFVEQGYAATTIAGIAARAGISVPTLYVGFASKADLLRRAVEVALAGDDDPVAVADRPTARWVAEAETAGELLDRYAVMMGELAPRAAPIYAVLLRTADGEPELAALRDAFEAQRLQAATTVAEGVAARGGLPAGRTVADAADSIWICNAPELYVMLSGRRGWTTERYVTWAREALRALVLAPPP